MTTAKHSAPPTRRRPGRSRSVELCAGCRTALYGDPAEGVGLTMFVDPMNLRAGRVHYGSGCIHKVPNQAESPR